MNTREELKFGGRFTVTCHDKDGNLKWEEEFDNLVTNEGLAYLLDNGMMGTTWYVMLLGSAPTIGATDTMSTISTQEVTGYSEAARPTYSGTRTSLTVSNSASKATFTSSAAGTIGGAALTSDATKGGTTGTLLCGAAFSQGDRTWASGDTVNVQYDFSVADDGV